MLQNWEGDWMLRGEDKKWNPPPKNYKEVCERMQQWLAARQRGVNEARAAHAGKTKCIVAHAAEVNLVADGFRGIPTMTREVLPGVELDCVLQQLRRAPQGAATFLELPCRNPQPQPDGVALWSWSAQHWRHWLP